MAPFTATEQTARNKAVWILAVGAAVAFGALWLNGPSRKQVDFEVFCSRFIVPVAMTLDLNHAEVQIKQATLFGFDGSVSQIAGADVNIEGRKGARSVAGVTFTPDPNSPPPYLKLVPGGALGTATLQLDPGVVLAVGDEGALRLETGERGAAHLVLQSRDASFEGNRYVIEEIASTADVLSEFSIAATGGAAGLFVDLRAQAQPAPTARAAIDFAATTEDRELLSRSQTISLAGRSLQLLGASRPSVRIDTKTPPDLEVGRAEDVIIQVRSGTLAAIAVAIDPMGNREPTLRVSGSVEATSVQQAGRELLPTWIEEALSTSDWERSAWLAGLGIAAFILVKVVNHAVEILLKLYIGE